MDRYGRAGTRYQAALGNHSVAGMRSEGGPFWVGTSPLRAVRRGLDLPPVDNSKAPVPRPRVGGSEGDRAGAHGLTGTGPSQNIEDRPSSLPLFVGGAKNGRPRKFARGHFYTGGEAVGSTAPSEGLRWDESPVMAACYGPDPPSTASSPITIPIRPPDATRQVATLTVWDRSVASSGLS